MITKPELFRVKGFIEEITVQDRGTKDNIVRFSLKGDTKTYSLFGDFKYKAEDEIEFDYKIKDGVYFNVYQIIDHTILNTEPITDEKLEQITNHLNPGTKPLAMDLAFRYGTTMKYSIEEIYALYEQILGRIE